VIDFLAAGTCSRCTAPLAAAQRYCLSCGERRGALSTPFRPPQRSPEPVRAAAAVPGALQGRRSLGAVSVVVLASGVLMGAAVGPALTPSSFASAAGQVLLVATGPAGAGAVTAAGSGAGGQTASLGGQLAAPTGNVAQPAARVVNAGGSASAAPTAGSAGASPVTTPAPSSPTPTTPTPSPSPTPQPANTAPTVSGTVVHLSHSGHGYAVATKEGQLIALHATKEPKVGDRIKTEVKPLANGTFQQTKPKVNGHADTASFHGTVTFAEADGSAYTVSAHGVSLLVHLPPADPSAPPRQAPAVGTLTTVDVAFKPVPPPPAPAPPPSPDAQPAADAQPSPDARQLEEVKRTDGSPAAGDLDLEAIVRSVSADHTQLTVSADDAGESAATLVLRVPPKVDVSKLAPGNVVAATVKREADGTLTLVTVGDDSNRKAADARAATAKRKRAAHLARIAAARLGVR
jgi:hypothetical protein